MTNLKYFETIAKRAIDRLDASSWPKRSDPIPSFSLCEHIAVALAFIKTSDIKTVNNGNDTLILGVLRAISQSESMLNHTFFTNLAGYISIAECVAKEIAAGIGSEADCASSCKERV